MLQEHIKGFLGALKHFYEYRNTPQHQQQNRGVCKAEILSGDGGILPIELQPTTVAILPLMPS